jgi:hypothetical protein
MRRRALASTGSNHRRGERRELTARGEQIGLSTCRRRVATLVRSERARRPIRSASRASMVAILAQRTTDGAGSPAMIRSETGTSPRHRRFSALVIIRIHRSPWTVSSVPAATTKAGRCWRIGRSVYGNGTLTRSHISKIGIGSPVVLRGPLAEGGERIVPDRLRRLREDDTVTLDCVGEHIAFPNAQRCSDRLGYSGLRLTGEFARDHGRCGGKDIPYIRKGASRVKLADSVKLAVELPPTLVATADEVIE